MLITLLSIAGCLLLSGFMSKDLVLFTIFTYNLRLISYLRVIIRLMLTLLYSLKMLMYTFLIVVDSVIRIKISRGSYFISCMFGIVIRIILGS